jgi:nicotinamidase-related amidase
MSTTPTAPFRDAPRGGTALLIVDMIGPMDHDGAEAMLPALEAAADRIAALRDACTAAEVPTIFVNDNFGEWHSEAGRLVGRAMEPDSRGRPLAERLRPRDEDYFVIKPQLSGFYATNLPVLLPKLGISRLIVTGTAADMCVLLTAADAYMRDYALWVPEDCTVGQDAPRQRWALDMLARNLNAETAPTDRLPLDRWLDRACTAQP